MELEDLKSSWQELGKIETPIGNEKLKKFIHGSSHSPLARIRKNMLGEIIAMLFVLMCFYVYVLLEKQPSQYLYLGLGVLTAITVLVLVLIFPKLYSHSSQFGSSKAISYNLEKNVIQLQNDVNLYEKTMLFLYLPACFAGFAMSGFVNKYIIIFFVLFFPIYYILVKKWVKNFYGQYVDELEQMVKELEE